MVHGQRNVKLISSSPTRSLLTISTEFTEVD